MSAHLSLHVGPGMSAECHLGDTDLPVVTVRGGDLLGGDGWYFSLGTAVGEPGDVDQATLDAAWAFATATAQFASRLEILAAKAHGPVDPNDEREEESHQRLNAELERRAVVAAFPTRP